MRFTAATGWLVFCLVSLACRTGLAQDPAIRFGAKVPTDVRMIYQRGLHYLTESQQKDGAWIGQGGSTVGQSGITGMCLMAFLASGEDPNFGKYSLQIRKGLRSIIRSQSGQTGYIGGSMYHHGFATLGLAEAYGVVDDDMVWQGEQSENQRTIGEALDLAVRCAVTSQKSNQWGGWRYSPQSPDADTSVSGAVLVGLLAARNAGIEVPDETIEKALGFFRSSTSDTGMVAYTGGLGGFGESMNRSAIGTLVFAIGKRKDWKEYAATLQHLRKRLEHQESSYPFYFRYYMAQALFQGDFDGWSRWNRLTTRRLKEMQQDDGSFQSGHGQAYGTSMSLLALALNYRFLPIYER